ncbi:hypothetical protein [Streptomyces sp. NBC_01205]|uniref:hypothetical protein n=1 Tax=Streptomyces sp. NBC_01205 TaxID=2903771 RepID=UPI002E153AA8|nr:hypothetical protein OG573_15660 [Streptomyces sp. NBC_01205]
MLRLEGEADGGGVRTDGQRLERRGDDAGERQAVGADEAGAQDLVLLERDALLLRRVNP